MPSKPLLSSSMTVFIETLSEGRANVHPSGTVARRMLNAGDLMSQPVHTCRPDADLDTVTRLMWDQRCSFIPVVDGEGRVLGVLTNGDVADALTARRLPADRIAALQAMVAPVHVCLTTASVSDVLATMTRFRVRRLPVIDSSERAVGVISINDLSLAIAKAGGPVAMEVVSAMAVTWKRRGVRN